MGVAQQFQAGLGAGFREINSGRFTWSGTTLEITNRKDERYLVPFVNFKKRLSRRWYVEVGLQYQPGGLSLQVYDQPGPGCPLCPVRKGTLVAYREILPAVSGGFVLYNASPWRLSVSAGVMPAFRIAIRQSPTTGLKNISRKAQELLAASGNLPKKLYWNGRMAVDLTWNQWSLTYQYAFLLDQSLVNALSCDGREFSFTITQNLQTLSIAWSWGRF